MNALTPGITIRTGADMAAWTVRTIADQRKLRSTRSTVLGMLDQVTRDQGPTLARALRDAQARRFA